MEIERIKQLHGKVINIESQYKNTGEAHIEEINNSIANNPDAMSLSCFSRPNAGVRNNNLFYTEDGDKQYDDLDLFKT